MDTELNLALHASLDDKALRQAIRRVRVNLLAEHAGLRHPSAVRFLADPAGLVERLDNLARQAQHRLRPLSPSTVAEDRDWLRDLQSWGLYIDPRHPLEETLFEPSLGPRTLRQGLVWLRDKLLGSSPVP